MLGMMGGGCILLTSLETCSCSGSCNVTDYQGIMSITLHVSLLSGRRVSLDTGLDVEVEIFKQQAQRALSAGKGRLVRAFGSVLDGARTIRESGLQNDDVLNLQIQPVRLLASQRFYDSTRGAFAAILGDASVATWGHPGFGGDCSAVQDS